MGYMLNTEWKITFPVREDGVILDFTDSDPDDPNYSADKKHQLKEQVIRGDVRVEKENRIWSLPNLTVSAATAISMIKAAIHWR